jgi:hypothetical protein
MMEDKELKSRKEGPASLQWLSGHQDSQSQSSLRKRQRHATTLQPQCEQSEKALEPEDVGNASPS